MDEIKRVSNKGRVSMLKLVIIVIVLLAVGFGALYALNRKDTSSGINTLLGDNAAAVIAVVNGEEIQRADFDKLLIEQKTISGEPQNEVEQQALQNQVLDILTSKALLLQYANESGISIKDEDIDSKFSQIRAQFPDEQAFADALSEQGFTQETLSDFLRNDLLIKNYVNSQVDLESVTVNDEEVKNAYDLAATKQDNLPELEVLSEPIRAQLMQQKQQLLVSQFIEKLKSESDIETFLE